MESEGVVQELGDDALPPEHLYPCVCPDERRRQVGDNNENIQKTASFYFHAPHEVCQREAESRR